MRSLLLAAAILYLGACDHQPRAAVQLPFCDVVSQSQSNPRAVRFQAQLIVSDHGAILADERCAPRAIAWRETEELRRSSNFDDFRRLTREVLISVSQRPLAILVDVEGDVRTPDGSVTPVLQARRIYAFETVPSIVHQLAPTPQ